MHLVRNQLRKVLVGRNHQHLVKTSLFSLISQSTYYIVSLIASLGDHRNAKTINHAMNVRQRLLNILRHSIAVGLILLITFVAECRLRKVERNSTMSWMLLTEQIVKRRRKTKNRRSIHTSTVHTRVMVQGIVSSVNHSHPVEQH